MWRPPARDVALYHLGNNAQHAAIYRRALETPGVIVLHDAVLHHFLLGQLDRSAYIEEFVYNYGEWNRGLAADLWRERAASGSDPRYFAYPMLRRIAGRARAVVVHNPAAAAAVKQHAPQARVVEIPHLFHASALPSESEAIRFRQRLGVGHGTRLFGVFGYLRESKRLFSVLQAFAAVHRELPETALLVAGAFVSTDLARAAAPLAQRPGRPSPAFPGRARILAGRQRGGCRHQPALSRGGRIVGYRHSPDGYGQAGHAYRSAECARFPEDACIRIPAGPAEPDSLREHLILLTSMSVVARAIGQRGARHIREHHRVEPIGNRYWELLSEYCT